MRGLALLVLAALSAIAWAQPTVKVSFSDGGDFDIQGGARMSTCPPNKCACTAGGADEPVQARWGNPGCHSTAFNPGTCGTAPSPCGANQFPSGYFQSGLGYDSISTGDGVTIPNNGQKTVAYLYHYNWNIMDPATDSQLDINSVKITVDGDSIYHDSQRYVFTIDETDNFLPNGNRVPESSCKYKPVTTVSCPDKVTVRGVELTKNFKSGQWTCKVSVKIEDPDNPSGPDWMITQENKNNRIPIVAELKCTCECDGPAACCPHGANGCPAVGAECPDAGNPVCKQGQCTATGACSSVYFPNDPRCSGPTAICQLHKCDPAKGCVEGIPAPNDPRCNDKPPNPATPVQDQDCNAWLCSNGACIWTIKPNGVCDDYNFPPGSPTKDAQCWKPQCVRDANGMGACQGTALPLNPAACPPPVVNGAPVNPNCYIAECASDAGGLTGYCSTKYFAGDGGPNSADHVGNCPMLPQYDPQCYAPYCNQNGQCEGNIFFGKSYTQAGNWTDGTQGVRTWDYTIQTANGPVTYPGNQLCTIGQSSDVGNTKYPQWNPQCVAPRCTETGKCGVDTINWGFPCVPIDGRATGGYNEVFIGAPNWPGVVPECVYYECGSIPGEAGHCIQRNKPGGRVEECTNSDGNLCSYDYCDGNGMCKDHEWKQGASPEGICVISTCDPATGDWNYTRNGNVCCGNEIINTGEQCEVGLNGADSLCCVNCYVMQTCDDGNVCTTETCSSSATCVRTLAPNAGPQCPPLDQTIPDNLCRMQECQADPDTVGACVPVPDASQNGIPCKAVTDPNACYLFQCVDGACTAVPDQTKLGQPCVIPGANATICNKFVCAPVAGGSFPASCVNVADTTQSCNDRNACTADICADVDGVGVCQSTEDVQCTTPPGGCFAPAICDPNSGTCITQPILGPCPRPDDYLPQPHDNCNMFTCVEGVCMRSADDCPCGNGRLDLGEECDWSMNAYENCCSYNCTGCLCGNGRLDHGEECDFGIASQLGCCNATCQGCLCSKLSVGALCDPTLQDHSECCNGTCLPCHVNSKAANTAVIASVTVVGLIVAIALAAAVFLIARRAAQGGVAAGGSGDAAYSQMNDNPLFNKRGSSHNPLYDTGAL